eukprot:scaffold15721_cov112-Isochrysis_galbana.AAC.5
MRVAAACSYERTRRSADPRTKAWIWTQRARRRRRSRLTPARRAAACIATVAATMPTKAIWQRVERQAAWITVAADACSASRRRSGRAPATGVAPGRSLARCCLETQAALALRLYLVAAQALERCRATARCRLQRDCARALPSQRTNRVCCAHVGLNGDHHRNRRHQRRSARGGAPLRLQARCRGHTPRRDKAGSEPASGGLNPP